MYRFDILNCKLCKLIEVVVNRFYFILYLYLLHSITSTDRDPRFGLLFQCDFIRQSLSLN